MKRKKSWFQILNKKERKHVCLTLTGKGKSLSNFMEHREWQKKTKAENPDWSEPCWECRMIERKVQEKGFIK